MAGAGIEPFRLRVPQGDLDDLRERLERTRWPDELDGVGWDYGAPLGYVRELADHWRERYDWRAWEARLNALAQFTTRIDGERIHFVHVRSPEKGALALVLSHGWPGSIVEFLDVIAPLADPLAHGGAARDAFHVVVPSLPGYGLSGPTHSRGWDPRRIARAWAELMRRLGYDRYGAQGGDWGSRISTDLGLVDPEHVVGVHVNMLATGRRVDEAVLATLDDADRARLERLAAFNREGAGYQRIQATRPQTLAYGLTDSPVGLLAWIVEKFREWTDSTDLPEEAIDRDALLTNVTLYWLTGTIGSSIRLYYEFAHGPGLREPPPPSEVPLGVAVFPREIAPAVRRLAEATHNVAHWTEMERGGHFAAMEQPELLVEDVRAFFRALR